MNKQAVFDQTTTALAGSATYTGAWRRSEGYSRLSGTVFADVAGTLKVQYSGDGVNQDGAESDVAVTANTATKFGPFEVLSPYVRVVYVNGATGQATLRLYPMLKEQN